GDLVEAGLAVHDRRQRDEEPALPAARDRRRAPLRVARDEVVVVLDPADEVRAIGAAVLERRGEVGVDRGRADQRLQLLDQRVGRDTRAGTVEGVERREIALVRMGRGRAAERGGHGASLTEVSARAQGASTAYGSSGVEPSHRGLLWFHFGTIRKRAL